MPLKSKAQIRKWGELVKQGEITQAQFDEALKATKNPGRLPERIAKPIKIGKTKIIK